MKDKLNVKKIAIFCILFCILFAPKVALAMDLGEEDENIVNEKGQYQIQDNNNSIENNTSPTINDKENTSDNLENVDNDKENTNDNLENTDNGKEKTNNPTEDTDQEYKVSVIINKVDINGNYLKGAILQILDIYGNVIDEWESDGSKHEVLLPEGDYILHEKIAPIGYKLANDQSFTVKAVINEINAGTDHEPDREVCWHYGGVALYYVESNGEKEEVYCINQGWDEPDNTNYDGMVLTGDNIKTFTPDADETMSSEELYNKVLDIIYHRSNASNYFPDLSETAIRYITEFAIKNYTSANLKENDNVTYQYRDYRYDPTVKEGFVKEAGTGNALGQLAKHWWYYHGRKHIPSIYADLYNYLVSNDDPHPEDMHLYIYKARQLALSGNNYQNLLGVRWFNPYDEDTVIHVNCINELKDEEKEVKNIYKMKIQNPKTGDNINGYFIMLFISIIGLISGPILFNSNKKAII